MVTDKFSDNDSFGQKPITVRNKPIALIRSGRRARGESGGGIKERFA